MELEFSRQIYEKSSNIKFNGNPSSGSRNVPFGRTDGQTDMTKLIVAFRNFANAPKKKLLGIKKNFRQTHTYALKHACKIYVSNCKHKEMAHTSQVHELTLFIPTYLQLRYLAAQACVQCVPGVQAHRHVSKKVWYFCVPFAGAFATLRQPTVSLFMPFFFFCTGHPFVF